MQRKKFLTSLISGAACFKAMASKQTSADAYLRRTVIPPYLKPNDVIGVTSPAGYITLKDIQPALLQMQSWGFRIKVGNTIGKKDFTFGGSDEERAQDMQEMMDDPDVNAIMCARGGYGAVRIIDKLDFTTFAMRPKWIVGFSDITVLHNHLNYNLKTASIHSKMCNSFPDDWSKAEPVRAETIISISKALKGFKMEYPVMTNVLNKPGTADGELVGGNLKTIESLSGTRSDLITRGKILIVEDTGEYLYSIDRMFWNLKRTGKLTALKGLIVGGFKVTPDPPGEEFGKSIYEIVLEKVKEYSYPVCFDFPVGHQVNNYALKLGVMHRLTVNESLCSLTEI